MKRSRTCICVIKVCFPILLLIGVNTDVSAQQTEVEGRWLCGALLSSGISSDRHWEAAEPLVGQEVEVIGDLLSIPGRPACEMLPVTTELRDDDLFTWGSGGGSWADIGLQPNDAGGYPVLTMTVTCHDTQYPEGVILIDAETIMLEFVRVWVECRRVR